MTPGSCQAASSQATTKIPIGGISRSARILRTIHQMSPMPSSTQPISQNRIQNIEDPGIGSGPAGVGAKLSEKIQRRYT